MCVCHHSRHPCLTNPRNTTTQPLSLTHAQAQSIERREGASQLYIPVGPKLGDIVVSMKGVTKGFEGRLLYENLDLDLPR